jgi:hypothetical protein
MDEPSFFDSDFFFGFLVCLFLAEFVTGVVQVVGAIIRTIIKLNKGEPLGHLKTYWIIVGIYFFVLAILYSIYRYILNIVTASLLNAMDLDNTNSYESSNYDNYMSWTGYLGIAMAVWIFLAWAIAIWYNIKIVFNRKPGITETEHV